MIAAIDPVQLAAWLWLIPQAIGLVITVTVVALFCFMFIVILFNK